MFKSSNLKSISQHASLKDLLFGDGECRTLPNSVIENPALTFIVKSFKALDLQAKNVEMCKFFKASDYNSKCCALKFRRREDNFLLQGLEQYLNRATSGCRVRIAEEGAGSSLPSSPNGRGHVGQPWLSRSIAKSIGLLSLAGQVTVTVADARANNSQLIIKDSKGALLFFMNPVGNTNEGFPYTSLHEAQSCERLAVYLKPEASNYLQSIGVNENSTYFHRPYLDKEYEELEHNLEVQSRGYDDNQQSEKKYDYIYGRHLRRSHHPRHCPDEVLHNMIETMRARLAPEGEARLIFDHEFMPKMALIVRHGYFGTQIVPYL